MLLFFTDFEPLHEAYLTITFPMRLCIISSDIPLSGANVPRTFYFNILFKIEPSMELINEVLN